MTHYRTESSSEFLEFIREGDVSSSKKERAKKRKSKGSVSLELDSEEAESEEAFDAEKPYKFSEFTQSAYGSQVDRSKPKIVKDAPTAPIGGLGGGVTTRSQSVQDVDKRKCPSNKEGPSKKLKLGQHILTNVVKVRGTMATSALGAPHGGDG
ncbi:hypothetical protein NE237_025958 [Protea cynaroides]|uniref:Uncharacterized protein n=1 Tax=Protea cynaroides TaxID=273540 RepID=A0A9Q0K109_9MAGN|nr:hypothetical protein NE237_025958 [Protea cynaroides]